MDRTYSVYILASASRSLYTGVTNNLQRRLAEHRSGSVPGFTSRYRVFRLVHYEVFSGIHLAIAREKEIKAWRREKKVWLVERENRTWRDLSAEWFFDGKQKAKTTADPSPPSKSRPGSG